MEVEAAGMYGIRQISSDTSSVITIIKILTKFYFGDFK